MTVKELIQNVEDLKVHLNEVSVYDLDVHTSLDLYYTIAKKFNIVIKELMRFEGVVSDEVIKQNEKLVYLLGEGLNSEVVNKINNMVSDGTIDKIINTKLFNDLNSQIKERATKQELEVERNRIDTFTTLQEGSTTGDAELLDIRIGANGTLYKNAGESVRKQISECVKYSPRKNIFNKNSNDKIEGYYINRENGYKNTNDNYCCYILKINPRSVISINKNTGIHVCFATEYSDIVNMSTNTIINGFISGTSGGSNIQVPTNAKYMTISAEKKVIDTLQIEYGQSSTYFEEYKLCIPEIDAVSKDLSDFKQINQDKLNIINVITNIVNYDTAEDGYYYSGFNTSSTTVDKQTATNYKAWQPVTVKKGVTYSFYGNISMNFSGIVDNAGNKIDKLGNIVIGNTFSVDENCLLYITTTGSSKDVMVINDIKEPDSFIPFGQNIVEICNEKLQNDKNDKKIFVGEGEEYTTLKSAIEYATQYENSKIFVKDGIYDLVSEFGEEVESSIGLVLKNNVHIIFSSNSKVTFNYEGDSTNVHTLFSPFNSGENGFIIENLTLEAKNCRYCVHDERGNTLDSYRNIYRNCKFSLDNTNNPDWTNPQNIGIGFGTNGYIEIDGCVLNSWITFHNNNGIQTQYKNKLLVKNCYFEKGAIMGGSTGSGTDKSIIQAFNNSFYQEHQITEGQNIKAYIYNNEVRS